MGEAIAAVGIAAAFAQLIHYGIASADDIYNITGRLRSSDDTVQQWTDDLQGLRRLVQSLETNASLFDEGTLEVLQRHIDGIDTLSSYLRVLTTDKPIGRFTRCRKALKVVFRQKDIERRFSAFRHVSDSFHKLTLQSNLQDLRNQFEELSGQFNMHRAHDQQKGSPQNSIGTVSLYMNTLTKQNLFAADLLLALCLLDTTPIPMSLPSLIHSPLRANEAISVLRSNALIEKGHTSQHWQLDPTVRDLIRSNPELLSSFPRHIESMVNVLYAQIPELLNCKESLDLGFVYQPHIESLLGIIFERFSEEDFSGFVLQKLKSLVERTVNHLQILGYYKRSRDISENALEWGAQNLFSEKQTVRTLLSHQAIAEQRMGNYKSFVEISRFFLCAQPSPPVSNSPEAIRILTAFGLSHHSQFKLDAAIGYHTEALFMKKRLYGEDHISIFSSLNNLAICVQSQGKYKEAECLFRSILAQRKSALGQEDPAIFRTLNNLAISLQLQERYPEAERCYRASLAGKKRIYGRKHHETLRSKINLAKILHVQTRSNKAEKMLWEVIANFDRDLGAGHPETLQAYQILSQLLSDESRYRDGATLIRQVLPRARNSLGNSHPRTIGFIHDLALSLHWQGFYAEALEYATEVRDLRINNLGLYHRDTQKSCQYVEQLMSYIQDSKKSILSCSTLVEEKAQFHVVEDDRSTSKSEKGKLAMGLRNTSVSEPTAKPWFYRHLRTIVALPRVLGFLMLLYGIFTGWRKS